MIGSLIQLHLQQESGGYRSIDPVNIPVLLFIIGESKVNLISDILEALVLSVLDIDHEGRVFGVSITLGPSATALTLAVLDGHGCLQVSPLFLEGCLFDLSECHGAS